jgi:hypothetical protein
VKEEISKTLLTLIRGVGTAPAATEAKQQAPLGQAGAGTAEAASISQPTLTMMDVLSSRAVCVCMSACQWFKGRQGMLAFQNYLGLETKLGAGLSSGTPKDLYVSVAR